MLTPFGGGDPFKGAKNTGKGFCFGQTDGFGDLSDGVSGDGQQPFGFVDAPLIQIFVKRNAERLLKNLTETRFLISGD